MLDNCGMSDCGSCIRQDADHWETHGLLVNYVGDYAIATRVAEEYTNPIIAMLATALCEGLPPRYMTTVGYVGSGSLLESIGSVADDDFHRFIQRHNDPENAVNAHYIIVEGVKNGTIDVSCPLTDDDYEEQMAY